MSPPSAAYLAAHRFGWSEASTRQLEADPRGWVLEQFLHPAHPATTGLPDSARLWQMTRAQMQARQPSPGNATSRSVQSSTQGKAGATAATPPPRPTGTPNTERADDGRNALRQASVTALGVRWNHIIATPTPVAERWIQFWANHFCVSGTRAPVAPLVWAYEREAIRPFAFGPLVRLLKAATLHPAMLMYLDNAQSVGPDSPAGQRRDRGLNENLARELLELHTLGVRGGYTQADVTEAARLLTGWTVSPQSDGHTTFMERTHQPGTKTVMGKRYPVGKQAIDLLLADLAVHPATAKHLATKLVRHFVTEQPLPELVNTVALSLRTPGIELRAVARTLFSEAQTWSAALPPKWKRPEELVLSAHRMLKWPIDRVPAAMTLLTELGQPPGRPPSPQGWADQEADWLSPQSLWQRVRWAEAFARQHSNDTDTDTDARMLADLAYGPMLSDSTRQEIARADSGTQALALLLSSPEFQRR